MKSILVSILLSASFTFAQTDVVRINENLDILAEKIVEKYDLITELSAEVDPATLVSTDDQKAIDVSLSAKLAGTEWTAENPVAIQAKVGAELNTQADGSGMGAGYANVSIDVDVPSLITNAGVQVFGFLIEGDYLDPEKVDAYLGCPGSELCDAFEALKTNGELGSIDKFLRLLVAKMEQDTDLSERYRDYLAILKDSYSTRTENGKIVELIFDAKGTVEFEGFSANGSAYFSVTESKVELKLKADEFQLTPEQMATTLDYFNLGLEFLSNAEEEDLDIVVDFIDGYAQRLRDVFP